MTEIYSRVAEDYRPFNVNVTTDSTKYWAAPSTQRMRIILTITSDWYGSAGGVSYIGSFTWGDNTPGFVFTKLLNYNTKYVAEAASHEAGHTLGLQHQALFDTNCAYQTDYNPGVGSGEIGWAPIMGVGYYRNLTLWNNGSNPRGCTNYQNDLKYITSYNGFSYRPDDYTSDFKNNTTTQANFVNNKFSVGGVIETSGDVDVVKFTVPSASQFQLDAMPYNLGDGYTGANLDMQVDLLNSAKTVIGTYNPSTQLKASVDTVLSAGTYYLQVQGRGNVYAPEYASLGSYTLQASLGTLTVLPVHKLELHGRKDGSRNKLDWIIEADEAVNKQTLELSTNGRDFFTIAQLEADARAYTYVPNATGSLQYRLNVEFDNGRQYYSNIIAIPNTATAKPSLVGNLVQQTISVNSPALFDYQISDYSGRLMMKGKLVQGMNKITSPILGRGMYIIQFSNGNEQFTEKFMKQ